jgi:ABC-type multidrug transport system ATPase subunit
MLTLQQRMEEEGLEMGRKALEEAGGIEAYDKKVRQTYQAVLPEVSKKLFKVLKETGPLYEVAGPVMKNERQQTKPATLDNTSEIAIEIKNISRTFKNIKALDNVSLNIHRNEIFALLGPNGSGKTTLLRIISTLMSADQPVNGKDERICRIMGFNLFAEQESIRRIMGYVPQRDALYENLSALDNLILFSTPYDLDNATRKSRIRELLELVKLYDRKDSLVKTYSGGMLKRLSIICALVHRPSVLFLDEVTVGLDTQLRHEIWSLLSELKKQSTIVLTTHYVPDAETYCDRVAMIYNGHILDCGKPAELVKKCAPAANLEEVTLLSQK